MENRDRILFIATNNLYLRTGGGLANFAFFEAIKKIFPEKVDIILPQEACEEIKENYFPVPRRNRLIALLSLFTGHLHRFRRYVIKHIKKYPNMYKLCVINEGMYAGDMINYIQSMKIKVVVIHYDYSKEYHLDNKSIATFYGIFPYYVIRNERNAYYRADLNLFLTKADMVLFERQYGKSNGKRAVIGTFEPFRRRLPIVENGNRLYTMVITGSLGSRQTECGIKDFYKNYYVLLRKEFPNIKILFAGRDPTKTIMSIVKKETDNMTIIRNPGSMEEIVRQGIIYYCPTNVGGGLKLRVMDGLRQGLPVLAHKVSARGYDVFFDKPYFKIYYDKESFKSGLVSLINLYNKNKIDGKQIQDDYKNIFDLESGCKRLKASLSLLGE
jgi:hypothetical protein